MSARTRRGVTLLWAALFVLSLLLQSASFAAPASSLAYVGESAASPFELDGNAVHASGHDWDQVYADRNGPPYPNADADNLTFLRDGFGANDDIFTGGNTKDIDDVSSWLWKTGSVQDKDDIENAFAAAYTAENGHTIGYFGLDRYQTSGDATAGFWFFKNDVAKANKASQGGFEFSGTHAEGDILVVLDFTNGGASASAHVYEWHAGGLVDTHVIGGVCGAASQPVCAISNVNATASPWPYTPKSGTANTFPGNALFEGGLDLTAAGLDSGCFSTFLAETRSSQETTATLSDFALGSFSFCEQPAIQTQVSHSSVDVGDSVTDVATLSGNKGTVEGSVDFFACGPTSSAQPCTSGGTKVGATKTLGGGAATSDAFTASRAGFYCFRAEYQPPEGSHYLATSHTNSTTECFEAKAASIHVDKTADDATVSAGGQIGFTVTLSNTGSGQAKGVSFSDDLPSGTAVDWSLDAAKSDPGWSVTGSAPNQHLAYSATTLDAGASTSAHVVSGTTKESCKKYDNTASVTTTNDGSDSDSASTTVLCAQLDVAKTADAASSSAGSPIGFTVTVANRGAGSATGVSLGDALPGGNAATPVHWVIDGATGDPAAFAITGADGGQQLTLAGQPISLAAGASLSVHVTAATSATSCATYDNTAMASSTNDGSDSASASTQVLCPALAITKAADQATVNAGDPIGFTIAVSNGNAAGTGSAKAVTLSDPLPSGVTWSISPAYAGPGTCSISGTGPQTLSCSFGDLAPGASVSVHVSASTSAQACATYPNVATAGASNAPSVQANASITCLKPSIQITKVADAHTVNAGETIGFTITVRNGGDGTATGVHVSDPLPTDAGTSWTIDNGPSGDTTGLTCGIAAGVLTCDKASLASGHSFSLHISSPTTAATIVDSPVDNTAVVTTTNDGSDQASDSVRIPDLTIDKSFTGNSAGTDAVLGVPKAKEGDTLTYTLAYTLVNGPVTDAVITDKLPQGLAYIAGTAQGNDEFTFTAFDTSTRTLRWDAATLTTSGTVTYQVRVLDGAADLAQPLTNTATIDSNETAPSSDSARVAVAPPPLQATGTPKPTLPPTDTIQSNQPTQTGSGLSLMVVLLGLAGLTLGIGLLVPAPARVRRRRRR